MAAFGDKTFTRGQVLRGSLAIGALAAAPSLLTACGTDSSSDQSASAATLKPGGTLRVGLTGGSAKDTLDAHYQITEPDQARTLQLFQSLVTFNAQREMVPLLAESMEPNADATVWTVKLRQGVTWHDGKDFTAADVMYSFHRILNPKDPTVGAQRLGAIDFGKTKVRDKYTIDVALVEPNAVWPQGFSGAYCLMVPEGYDPKVPVGTGPFKFKSFSPGSQSVFTRYDGYWEKGRPYVDELVMMDFANDNARINALLADQVDSITNLPASNINQVQSNSALRILENKLTGNFQPITMRVDEGALADVRVRQAMRMLVDRQQVVDQALSGHGRVANDLYAPFDSAYDTFKQREQDVEQAKSLLKQAGQSDIQLELVTSPVYLGMVQAATSFAAQATQNGVDVRIRQVDPGTFYGTQYLKWTFAQDYWASLPFFAQAASSDLAASPYNETHFNDPKFASLYTQAKRELDVPKRKDLIRQMQQIQFDTGGYLIWGFSNQIDAYSAKVGGYQDVSYLALPFGDYNFKDAGFVA